MTSYLTSSCCYIRCSFWRERWTQCCTNLVNNRPSVTGTHTRPSVTGTHNRPLVTGTHNQQSNQNHMWWTFLQGCCS